MSLLGGSWRVCTYQTQVPQLVCGSFSHHGENICRYLHQSKRCGAIDWMYTVSPLRRKSTTDVYLGAIVAREVVADFRARTLLSMGMPGCEIYG